MRKFIISDLHGNGEVYDSVMTFLESVSTLEEVELYINGDFIDWGFDSYRMLMDIQKRIHEKGNVKIHYLGGNHEWLLFQAMKNRVPHKPISYGDLWIKNGGWVVEGEMDTLLDDDGYETACKTLKDFTGSLKIIHVFDEKILQKPILLVHGQAPLKVDSARELKIEDDNEDVLNAVWKSEDEMDSVFGLFVVGKNRIGNPDYFTICGHYPVDEKEGFVHRIRENDSYFNIDGGCHPYAVGKLEYDHVPLVEVKDGYLDILVFNHNNQITSGYHFDGKTIPMEEIELNINRLHLNPQLNGNGEKNKQLILELKRDGVYS